MIIGGLERIGADQPAAAGLLECVFEFVETIGRIDVHQHHADLGGRELRDTPLRIVRRPNAQSLARLKTERQQAACTAIHFSSQLRPGVAQVLVTHDQGLTVGEPFDRPIERRTDGHRQQRLGLRSAGVARKTHVEFLSLMFVMRPWGPSCWS